MTGRTGGRQGQTSVFFLISRDIFLSTIGSEASLAEQLKQLVDSQGIQGIREAFKSVEFNGFERFWKGRWRGRWLPPPTDSCLTGFFGLFILAQNGSQMDFPPGIGLFLSG